MTFDTPQQNIRVRPTWALYMRIVVLVGVLAGVGSCASVRSASLTVMGDQSDANVVVESTSPRTAEATIDYSDVLLRAAASSSSNITAVSLTLNADANDSLACWERNLPPGFVSSSIPLPGPKSVSFPVSATEKTFLSRRVGLAGILNDTFCGKDHDFQGVVRLQIVARDAHGDSAWTPEMILRPRFRRVTH